ncbi:MAG: hypothetical protein AAGA54_02580 [Myxococcota bacterium]
MRAAIRSAAACCVGLVLSCSTTGPDAPEGDEDQPRSCPSLGAPVRTGTLKVGPLDEASGMVASHHHAGVLWSHNDGGDAELFAIDEAGTWLAMLTVGGATVLDLEDIARARTSAYDVLWLADIGDNDAVRPSVALIAVPEPEGLEAGMLEAVAAARVEVTYPNGPADAEAFFIDSRSGDGYIITKTRADAGPAEVLKVPGPLGAGPVTAESVAVVDGLGPITAADMAANGRALVVRSDDRALWWALDDGLSVEEALAEPGCAVPLPVEAAGESVAFTVDGAGYHSTSEGAGAPIHRVSLESG